MTNNDTFTKTEAKRRLRVIHRQLRDRGDVPFGVSFELYRYGPVAVMGTFDPTSDDDYRTASNDGAEFVDEGDYDYMLTQYPMQHGEVVTIRLWQNDGFECTPYADAEAWIGTANDEPVLVTSDGNRVSK
jgi:hypothetical protein